MRVRFSHGPPVLGCIQQHQQTFYLEKSKKHPVILADMAQLVAHIIGNDEVPSSNLGISTKLTINQLSCRIQKWKYSIMVVQRSHTPCCVGSNPTTSTKQFMQGIVYRCARLSVKQ